MVERDLGDHRDQRVGDDVGGVVAAAEPDLEQQIVGRGVGEELAWRLHAKGAELVLTDLDEGPVSALTSGVRRHASRRKHVLT